MDDRTQEYLKGRFSDYYRRESDSMTLPPEKENREWGFIPFYGGMVRHKPFTEVLSGDYNRFSENTPRHVYFSAAKYEDPSASTMEAKTWKGSDLVFDLDADHLPAVTLGEDSYAEMLSKCKDSLISLVRMLRDDFGFDDMSVVFSGGRGYHVHIRADEVQDLESEERIEIVNYIQAGDVIDFDSIESNPLSINLGEESKSFSLTGGYHTESHREYSQFIDRLLEMPEEGAINTLEQYEGIGSKRAEEIVSNLDRYKYLSKLGVIGSDSGAQSVAEQIFQRVLEDYSIHIDQPVTTDTTRLIRLPGSLHGGTGFEVKMIDSGDIDIEKIRNFNPFVDAVPDAFSDSEIEINVEEPFEVTLKDNHFSLDEGIHSVPEYVAIFAMAREKAILE